MQFRSSARPKPSFRPGIERSEPRFLLSGGSLAHAGVTRSLATPAAVKDWYAYYIKGRVQNTTPIYSFVLTNDTGDNLKVSLDATQTMVRNFKNGESFASGDDILVFTDHSEGKFVFGMTAPSARGSFAFKSKNGNQTSIAKGYLFSPAVNWYSTDVGLSNPFKVQIQGTGADKKLVIVPPL